MNIHSISKLVTMTGKLPCFTLNSKEVISPVIGWEGVYEISSYGYVITLARISTNNIPVNRKIKNTEVVDGGYHRVALTKRPVEERYMLHRLVAAHYIPNPLNLPEVNHLDGDKDNNAAYNLSWSTSKDNTKHAFDNGLKSGVKGKKKRIKESMVLEIFKSTLSLGKLSKLYHLPKLTIHSIKSGKRYGRVTGASYKQTA